MADEVYESPAPSASAPSPAPSASVPEYTGPSSGELKATAAQHRAEAKVQKDQAKVAKASEKAQHAQNRLDIVRNKSAGKSIRAQTRLAKVKGKRELAAQKADIALAKYEAKEAQDLRDAELLRRGLRRQWLTGKVVPVKQSKTGAVAHTRSKPSKFSWGLGKRFSGKKSPSVPKGAQ